MKNMISLDFQSGMSNQTLALFAHNVLVRMDKNPRFATLQHLVKPGLRTATQQFSKALQEAAVGSRSKVAEKNMAAKVLKSTLGNIARHLELQLNGEYALALEAGFNINTYAPRSNEVQLQSVFH
ncbi:MAG: hypothetical protein SFV22_15980 [Saprospiraceae bacterium]|nr:hypothetical protein [Saprospiraceae bacterium]